MPNRKARNSVGIIITSISERFTDNFIDLLCAKFKENGYASTLAITGGDLETEKMYISKLKATSDCLILLSCAKDFSQIEDCLPKNIPTIFLLHKPENCTCTCILENDYSAVYQGIISLLDRKAKKIAFVCTNMEHSLVLNALKAYKDALNVMSPDSFDESLIFMVDDTQAFNAKEILDRIHSAGCDAIFCSASKLTGKLMDAIMFYSRDYNTECIPLVGYSHVDSRISSVMYVDKIIPPYEEIFSMTVQQAIYQIKHPESEKRVLLLKGTLLMHRLNID